MESRAGAIVAGAETHTKARMVSLLTAGSLTLATTLPGIVTGRDHIIRADAKGNFFAVSKAVWCIVRLLNPLSCLVFGFRGPVSIPRSPRRRVLLAMSCVSGMRHAFWACFILRKPWPLLPLSLPVALLNNFFDALHCRCAVERERESGGASDALGPVACLGMVLFALGSCLETASELQRERFIKKRAQEADKKASSSEVKKRLCTTGLWSLAAHINYLGYALWRLGIGLVSAPPHTAALGVAHFLDFQLRAVPLLRRHLGERYGEEWYDYAKRTRVLVPGVI